MARPNRNPASSARSVLHQHEETIRRVLGDRDYQLLVRYLSGSVRLLQRLEGAAVPSSRGSRQQLKVSAEMSEDARRALEALSEHFAGALTHEPEATVGIRARKQLKILKGGARGG